MNNFAISSGGIGEALERSASSLMAANNTIDESIALITAANTVVQSPEQVGNAFKTISMRIRGAKTELEEAGLETDGMVESTAKLRSEILALTGVDIMDGANQFKSTYAIMDELAAKWKDLTDIQQATVTELIAGKRQGNIVSSLMTNFDTARDALETSLNSSGSAMQEHEKWQQSLEAQINKLKASWQGLSQSFLNSDFLKLSLDLIIGLVDGLTKLTDKFGTLGTIGLGAGIFALFKNKGIFTGILGSLSSFIQLSAEAWSSGGKLTDRFKNIGKAAGMAGGDISKSFTSSLSGIVSGIGLAVAAIALIVNAYKNYREEISRVRQETIQSADEFLDAASSFEQAYIKYSGRTDLTTEEEADLESAINGTVDALGDKSSALQNVVNSSNDYIASLEAITNAELEAAQATANKKKINASLELEDIAKNSFGNSKVDIVVGMSTSSPGGTTPESDMLLTIAQHMGSDFIEKQYDKNGTVYRFGLPDGASVGTIVDYYYTLVEYQNKIEEAAESHPELDLLKSGVYTNVCNQINEMTEYITDYKSAVFDTVKAQYQLSNGIPKTIEEYLKMREAILRSEDIKGLSLDVKNSIINTLDSEYGQVFDLSSAEVQAKKFIGLIEGYGDGTKDGTNDVGTVETFLNVRTAVNNGECSVGDYISAFKDVTSLGEEYSDEEKEYFTTSLGLDTDKIKQQYDDMYKYISKQNIDWFEGYEFTPEFRLEKDNIKDQEIRKFIDGLTATELQALVNIKTEIDWNNTSIDDIKTLIKEESELIEALNFSASIEIDKTALETLNTALEESASAMGMSKESIDSLKAKYAELDGYDPSILFERTANGVKVNREELAKLEKKYNDLNHSEVQKHIDSLTEAYNENAVAIDECKNAGERAQLIAENETYKSRIEELAEYQSQLEGVTGAYQRWLDAQNAPEDYEGYELIATSREDIEDEIDRGFISNASKEYIDLLSGENLQGGTIDDYASAWGKLDDKITGAGHSINDFFTVNDDGDITATGIDRFFKSVQTDFKGSIAEFNKETGKWEYNFSQENLQKIQDEWGLGIEAIELLLEAAGAAGYDVDWDGLLDNIDLDTSEFETLVSYAESAQSELNKLEGYENLKFNFTTTNVADATTEFERARKAYVDLITNDDGTVNLETEGAEEMRVILSTLLVQKQQLGTPAIMKVDTSQIDQAETDVIDVINKAQALQKAYENYEIAISTGVDVEGAKDDLSTAIDEMKGTSVDVRADLKLPTDEELQTAKNSIGDIKVAASLDETAIGNIESTIQTQCTPEVIAKVTGLNEDAIQNGSQKVVYTADHKDVDDFINSLSDISKKIIYTYTTEGTKPNPSNIERSITYKYKTEGDVPEAYGTAHSNGTANSGRAFARGSWGIKSNGTALGGELGQELIVRDGKFFTIGDKGAEFFHYKQNDIIFNAAQTESLFKYGGIKGAKPRGTMLATGSAFAKGNAFPWSATGTTSNFASNRTNNSKNKAETKTETSTKDNSVTTTTTTSWSADAKESDFSSNRKSNNSNSSSSKSSSKSKETKQEFEETLDWIEVAISRIEREIDNLDQKANNVYKSWSSRNTALSKQINEVGNEISLQQQAYDEYIRAASGVGLSESYASKVRNGTIDIETITDEALKEKIDDYQNYYESAINCLDVIEELKESESELYAQRFENIQTQYDDIIQGYEHTESMLNEYISQAEAQGYIVSKKYYNALIENEKSSIAELKKEQSDLIAERDKAVDEGKITKYSEAWYEQCAAIDKVTQSIEEANTALIEYSNSIREINWQVFDLIQERISDVTSETEFLIELMSNKDLFDDNGKLTEQGAATMGLHALNYNTSMYQSDEYGKEIAKLDEQIAKDPYDQELVNRRRELVELQRESILAAEDEKQSIKDLVQDGIDKELDALSELIDKKNESLEAEKDLYEYQKKVQEQTENIASLRKQMAAYENDGSEEAKAKIQELKVSLEEAEADLKETEWDKYIQDTQQILDTLYTDYETVLNTRLDNIDFLLSQVIDGINAAASLSTEHNSSLLASLGSEGTLASALGVEGAIASAIVNAMGENGSIKGILNKEVTAVGTKLSTAMNSIWSVGEGNAKSVLTMYGEGFQKQQTTTNTTLNSIKADVNAMVDDIDKDAQKKATANKTTTSAQKDPTKTTATSTSNKTTTTTTTTKTTASTGDGKPKVGDKVKFISGKYYYDSEGKKPLGSKYQGKEVYITSINTKSWATHPYHISTGSKLGSGDLGWLKLNQLSGYATGKKNLANNELAWTQENGQEYIIRPSDGAILTPIAKGDSVLNATASGNIWSMANNPTEFIKDNLRLDTANVPSGTNVNKNVTQNFENVVFSMPNVHSYNELISEMQRDPKFEKLIHAMTVDQIAGKSKLGKNKAIR